MWPATCEQWMFYCMCYVTECCIMCYIMSAVNVMVRVHWMENIGRLVKCWWMEIDFPNSPRFLHYIIALYIIMAPAGSVTTYRGHSLILRGRDYWPPLSPEVYTQFTTVWYSVWSLTHMLSLPDWSSDAIWNDNPWPSSVIEASSVNLYNGCSIRVIIHNL